MIYICIYIYVELYPVNKLYLYISQDCLVPHPSQPLKSPGFSEQHTPNKTTSRSLDDDLFPTNAGWLLPDVGRSLTDSLRPQSFDSLHQLPKPRIPQLKRHSWRSRDETQRDAAIRETRRVKRTSAKRGRRCRDKGQSGTVGTSGGFLVSHPTPPCGERHVLSQSALDPWWATQEVRQSNAWERFMALPSNSPRRRTGWLGRRAWVELGGTRRRRMILGQTRMTGTEESLN